MRVAFLVVILAVTLGGACTTATGGGRADVVDFGDVEAWGAVNGELMLAKRAPGRAIPVPAYDVAAGARVGVVRGVDVGWRGTAAVARGISNVGMIVDTKLQFLGAHDKHAEWTGALSVGASAARMSLGGADSLSLGVPVRIAFGQTYGPEHSQVFFGPAFAAEMMYSASAKPVSIGWSGAFLGYAWRIHPQFELRPELSVRYSPVKWNGLVESRERVGLTQIELSVGGVWVPSLRATQPH